MNKVEFIANFRNDLFTNNVNYALPTVKWCSQVDKLVIQYLNAVQNDRRVNKCDLFMAMGDTIRETLCHGDYYSTEMCLRESTDYLFFLYTHDYMGKKDKEKMKKLLERA